MNAPAGGVIAFVIELIFQRAGWPPAHNLPGTIKIPDERPGIAINKT
jgi:hypothetical protein